MQPPGTESHPGTHHVYMLYSETVDRYYIGYTQNLEQRLRQHNAGESRYKRGKGPWKLVYYETYMTKTEALKRERFLKAQRNREFYLRLMEGG